MQNVVHVSYVYGRNYLEYSVPTDQSSYDSHYGDFTDSSQNSGTCEY